MPQYSVPCAVYRGGTSRGLIFHEKDLPTDIAERNRIFMTGIDAWNPAQIDGLGGGTSHTSKVVVVHPPSRKDAVADYTFYQIGIGKPIVDDSGTCGNLMAAVGMFVIDEGLAGNAAEQAMADISLYNRNIDKLVLLRMPIENGEAKTGGNHAMPGVEQRGAKIRVTIMSPGGTVAGSILPLGRTYNMSGIRKAYTVSVVDCILPVVFVSAEELGLQGGEPISRLQGDEALAQELECIRREAAVQAGIARSADTAPAAVPKIAIIARPQDYRTSSGAMIRSRDVDIVARMMSMGKFHRTFAAGGMFCLAAALMLRGTIPHRLNSFPLQTGKGTVRIGHPEGAAEVSVTLAPDGTGIQSVGLDRTARRIMKGSLYVPVS